MTRCQAKNILDNLNEVLDKLIEDEDVHDDIKTALDFAIADMSTLQDVINDVNGVMIE